MIAATCSGVCGAGACEVGGGAGACALGARGFRGAAGSFLGVGSGSGGGSFSTIGSSGICSIIFGLFLLPGGRPRRLGTGASSGAASGCSRAEALNAALS